MQLMNRRTMLRTTAAAGAGLLTLPQILTAQEVKKGPFTLPPLPYGFDALEPHIDKETMQIHHDKHHQAYVNNLNSAVAGIGLPGTMDSLKDLLKNLDKVPEALNTPIRNNGGGHLNHSLFWEMMSPKGGKPGAFEKVIAAEFATMEKFFEAFDKAAMTRFGSGWAWLTVEKKKLKIVSAPNQDTPIMDSSGTPILGIDVWEHAYYLKYQNKRADYVKAFHNVINWEYVASLYDAAMKA